MNWEPYFQATKTKPPNQSLIIAVPLVKTREIALDLGAGALRDTKFLIESGFFVDIVDMSSGVETIAASLPRHRYSLHLTTFEKFSFKSGRYDLVNAQWALPFNTQDAIESTIQKLTTSLKEGGIFVGNFFGKNDDWNKNRQMNFQDEQTIRHWFSDFDLLTFDEKQYDEKPAVGQTKHWHVFTVIAKKKRTNH